MHYNEYTLPNGLRIIHEPTLSKVAYCGFAIDAGTRDEAEDERLRSRLQLQRKQLFVERESEDVAAQEVVLK